VSLAVVAVLLGLGMSPWLVGEAAANHDDRQPYKRTAVMWWYLREPNPFQQFYGFQWTNRLATSQSTTAFDGQSVQFTLAVVPEEYRDGIEDWNVLQFAITTGYADGYVGDDTSATLNYILLVKLHVTKVDPWTNCDNTRVRWPIDVPEAQGSDGMQSGTEQGTGMTGDLVAWGIDLMLDFTPALNIVYDVAELMAILNKYNPDSGFYANSVEGCDMAWYQWTSGYPSTQPDNATTYNYVEFDQYKYRNTDLYIRIQAEFQWIDYEQHLDPPYDSYPVVRTTTLGPIYLFIKEDYGNVGTVSLYPISDDDTTASSVALSWTQYDGADAPFYFRSYRIEKSSDGGTTWQSAGTVYGLSTTSFTVSGLQSETTYSFRVRVADVFSRIGDPSNVQTATTDPSGGGGGGGGGYPPPVPMGNSGPGT
jgi:hypothetical protein